MSETILSGDRITSEAKAFSFSKSSVFPLSESCDKMSFPKIAFIDAAARDGSFDTIIASFGISPLLSANVEFSCLYCSVLSEVFTTFDKSTRSKT